MLVWEYNSVLLFAESHITTQNWQVYLHLRQLLQQQKRFRVNFDLCILKYSGGQDSCEIEINIQIQNYEELEQ